MYPGNLHGIVLWVCKRVSVLRSIPSGTIDINLRSCVLNRHKLQQSQIATIQESLPSQFVICLNLWSRPWRHKLSPITLKTCSGYLGECPDSLLTWIWIGCIFTHFGVISMVYLFVCMYISYKAHNRCTHEAFLIGSDFDVNMFSALRSIPSVTIESIWEVVFWTVTNCDSHKLRHYRRNLWFVAICDQGRDRANWVQQHWKRVECT